MIYLAILGGVVLHELGHALCARSLGLKVKAMGISWRGVYTRRERGTPCQNMLVALAGPATNFLVVLLALFFWQNIPVIEANLLLGILNLLPLPNADGRRVVGGLENQMMNSRDIAWAADSRNRMRQVRHKRWSRKDLQAALEQEFDRLWPDTEMPAPEARATAEGCSNHKEED